MTRTDIATTSSQRCRIPSAASRRRRRAGVRRAVRDAHLARPGQARQLRLTPPTCEAIQAQNAQVSAGQLGGTPAVEGQQLNATITAQPAADAGAVRRILLRSRPDGSQVRLRDVARVELGGESYGIESRYNGKPPRASPSARTGANALDTADGVEARSPSCALLPARARGRHPVRHHAVRARSRSRRSSRR
jgi:hypothetical protein